MTDTPSASDAIASALAQNWSDAIKINSEILKHDKKNVDALNRMGFAYTKLGKVSDAKKTFGKVTSLDPYNQIAIRNLKKLETLKETDAVSSNGALLSPLSFLEDPGRTKIAQCVNTAPMNVLSTIHSGQEVYLKARNHCVEIRGPDQIYLGALPDDLSFRLLKFLEGGNSYQVFVRGVEKNALTVFIRELARGKRFSNQPSFSAQSPILAYAKDDTGDVEKPDVTPTGEEDTESDTKEKESA